MAKQQKKRNKRYQPPHPLLKQRLIGKLAGYSRIPFEAPVITANFLDLELRMWSLIDAATNGRLDGIGTNDMGIYGNVCTLVAEEEMNTAMHAAAQRWNTIVKSIRERRARSGKWGVTGEEYQTLRTDLAQLEPWLKSQSRSRIERAWNLAMAIRDDMLKRGVTAWMTDDPAEVLQP